MKKTIILGLVISGILFSTSAVFALTPVNPTRLAELKQQLATLLKQAEDVRKEIKLLESQNSDFCFTFNENFGFGARGSSVVALHTALAREGFAVSTGQGQYDEETAAAVTGFQEKYRAEILTPAGLKFGTGYVGKATRMKLNMLYACSKPATSLRVIYPNGGESLKIGTVASITWQESAELRVSSASYDIYVSHWIKPCTVGPCPMYKLAAPYPIAKSVYGNSYGWNVGSVLDGRTILAGDYQVKVCISGTEQCDMSDTKFEIYETPITNGNKAPIISGFEAPTQLKVGATGTWKVKASDPENGSLSYSITWGDEMYVLPNSGSADMKAPEIVSQSSTFTHSYSAPGEYKVRLVVRDSFGASTETTATTVVKSNEETVGTLKVRVLNGGIVCITTPCEFGLQGATVQIFDLSGTAILRTGTTDQDGYVTLGDLKPYLSYPVRIVKSGYITQETKAAIVSGQNSLLIRLLAEMNVQINQ